MATWKGSPNYTSGRRAKLDKIIIHWMVGTLASTDATFARTSSRVSAHYGIENKKVHQYVKESDTAWHAKSANASSIGIEHSAAPGRAATNETYETSAQLIADICKRYKLSPNTAVQPHNKYVATQCPGTMDLNRLKKRANEIMNGGDMKFGDSTLLNRLVYQTRGRTVTPAEKKRDLGRPWQDVLKTWLDFRVDLPATLRKVAELEKLGKDKDWVINTRNKTIANQEKEIKALKAQSDKDDTEVNILGKGILTVLNTLGYKKASK